jgi:parvulin-like peptidyl-prolyl isomerase
MILSLRRCAIWPLAAVVALAASGCHPAALAPNDPRFVVAQGGDWTITRAQLDHELDEYFKERQVTPAQIGQANMPALETAMLRNLVLEKLLLARAATKNFQDLDKVEAEAFGRLKGRFPSEQAFQDKLKQTGMTEDELKKRIHDQVLVEKLFDSEALKDTEPTDKEVNDFYIGHPNLFQVPLKLRASRVLVIVPEGATPAQKAAKKKLIDAARARVARGEAFSKVATEASDDRYSAPRGGDIGYFQRGENDMSFDNVAFASKVGVLSPVFETPMGYEFLEVTEIKPAGTLSIDDARSAIIQNLREINIAQQKKAYADQLMKDSKVTYNIPLTELPPETTNAAPQPQSAPPGAGAPADGSAQSPPPPADSTTVTNTAPGGQ